MAVKGATAKRRRKLKEDRLSSLPNDILIGIISLLPLELAVITGTLSHRWCNLWTNITSIQVTQRRSKCINEFSTGFNSTLKQITSPFIHSCSVEFLANDPGSNWALHNHSWLQEICNRHVGKLKLTFPNFSRYRLSLPNIIFKTPSLVSIEFDRPFGWQQLPYTDGIHIPIINLPNLKSLTLFLNPWQCYWLEKLMKACPSLEELSLRCDGCWADHSLECTNQKLRRLFVDFNVSRRGKVVIKSPKLEYLGVCASKTASLSFVEEPLVLREANINIYTWHHDELLTSEQRKIMPKLYNAVCNVRFLGLDVFALDSMNTSTVFSNATWVTLDMKMSHDIELVLSLLKPCPVLLDVLTLKFWDMSRDVEKHCVLPKPNYVKSIRRVIKRINIETSWYYDNRNPTEAFLELVEYLLSNVIDLERFNFRIVGDTNSDLKVVRREERNELVFCKLLYHCPTASPECEVEFVGKHFKMSRKAGRKVWRENGKFTGF